MTPTWQTLRPTDVAPEQWERIGALLEPLPPELFHPWRDFGHVVQDLTATKPPALDGCPDPILRAVLQLDMIAGSKPLCECFDLEINRRGLPPSKQ
jgi:hypothetical protein